MNAYITIPDDQREKKLEELVIVLHNLRYWTKYWKENLGWTSRRRKEYWEQKADELLTDLGLKQHMFIQTTYIARP